MSSLIYNLGFLQIQLYFIFGTLYADTLKCLSIGTPKAINFPFVSNEN